MNILQKIEEKEQKKQELRSITEAAKKESRKLTDTEEERFNKIVEEIENIKQVIDNQTKDDVKIKNNEKRMNFSLINAINEKLERRSMSDATLAIFEEGKRQMGLAGQNYGGDLVLPFSFESRSEILAGGNPTVPTFKFDLEGPLRSKLITVEAGSQFLTGLSGNLSLPFYTGANATWEDETGVAKDGAGTFYEKKLSPKKLTAFIDVSKQFLTQTSPAAEQLLINDLTQAIASKLESTIFGSTTGTNQPTGLFYGANYVVSGATSFDKIVDLETSIDTSNALTGNLGYIINPSLKGLLKKTTKVAGQPVYLLENNELNGYKVLSSNHVVKNVNTNEYGIVFGNWSDLIIASFGAVDLTIDSYTQATYGKIRIVINAYFDVIKRRDESFAVGSLK